MLARTWEIIEAEVHVLVAAGEVLPGQGFDAFYDADPASLESFTGSLLVYLLLLAQPCQPCSLVNDRELYTSL